MSRTRIPLSRADENARLRRVRIRRGDVLGHTEIDDLHDQVIVGVEGQHHIVGGDVAMKKAAQ